MPSTYSLVSRACMRVQLPVFIIPHFKRWTMVVMREGGEGGGVMLASLCALKASRDRIRSFWDFFWPFQRVFHLLGPLFHAMWPSGELG